MAHFSCFCFRANIYLLSNFYCIDHIIETQVSNKMFYAIAINVRFPIAIVTLVTVNIFYVIVSVLKQTFELIIYLPLGR